MTWRDTFAALGAEDKIAAAILCAWETTTQSKIETRLFAPWRRWAVGWLTGRDRSEESREYCLLQVECGGTASTYAARAARTLTLPEIKCELASSAVAMSERYGVDPDPILDDIAAGDLQKHIDRVEQELSCAP